MTKMIICGFSMEMELAEDLGMVGDCRMCRKWDSDGVNDYCDGELLEEKKTDCDEWLVSTM